MFSFVFHLWLHAKIIRFLEKHKEAQMDTLSNTTFLKRMGILDIIAAIFLVIMGALLLNVEFNAEFGGSAAIIQALKFLIALGLWE